MKTIIRALSVFLMLLSVVSCSKNKEVKPTSTVLFYAKSTASIGSYVEVELNGTVIGRLTSRFAANASPTCADSPSSRLIKVANVEVGVEQRAVFRRNDGAVVAQGPFTIDPSIKSEECWTVWID
jgi:hypothetical protein